MNEPRRKLKFLKIMTCSSLNRSLQVCQFCFVVILLVSNPDFLMNLINVSFCVHLKNQSFCSFKYVFSISLSLQSVNRKSFNNYFSAFCNFLFLELHINFKPKTIPQTDQILILESQYKCSD